MFDLAQKIDNPIDLSLGQAHFDVHEKIKEAAKKFIDSGANRYSVTQGVKELREKVFEYICSKYGYKRKETDDCIITVGATAGLFLTAACLVEEGDEILVPDPHFVLYTHLVAFFGGKPVLVDTYDNGFKLTPNSIKKHVTKNTRALIFNNPVNPTGIAYTPDEVRAIVKCCVEQDIFVVADEVYNEFIYDFPHETALNHSDNVLLISAFSKTMGTPGWRVGYAIGHRDLIDRMTAFQQFTYVCAPTPLQRALSVTTPMEFGEKIREQYRKKRDLIYGLLKESCECVKPTGAFYIFPKTPFGTDQEFVEAALQKKLILVPGSTGSKRNTHFRLSFAADDEKLKTAGKIIRELKR